jgi:methyl-accepting chemotaxis protein
VSGAEHDAADAEAAQAQIQQLFIGFQFQDRMNQVLTLLRNDMDQLAQLLANPSTSAADLDAQAWLARLESRYAMAEQHHAPGRAPTAAPAPSQPSEVEFF